jgi:hypothetical protein
MFSDVVKKIFNHKRGHNILSYCNANSIENNTRINLGVGA